MSIDYVKTSVADGEIEIFSYLHTPEDGTEPYYVVDVYTDNERIKMTLNDGTVFFGGPVDDYVNHKDDD